MATIYHIATQADWQQAQNDAEYRVDSLAAVGFIHFSTKAQILKVANAIYRGREDLLLLSVDTDKLKAELKWEAPDHPEADQTPETTESELFPHLYGALNLDAVIGTFSFQPNDDGIFNLPSELTS